LREEHEKRVKLEEYAAGLQKEFAHLQSKLEDTTKGDERPRPSQIIPERTSDLPPPQSASQLASLEPCEKCEDLKKQLAALRKRIAELEAMTDELNRKLNELRDMLIASGVEPEAVSKAFKEFGLHWDIRDRRYVYDRLYADAMRRLENTKLSVAVLTRNAPLLLRQLDFFAQKADEAEKAVAEITGNAGGNDGNDDEAAAEAFDGLRRFDPSLLSPRSRLVATLLANGDERSEQQFIRAMEGDLNYFIGLPECIGHGISPRDSLDGHPESASHAPSGTDYRPSSAYLRRCAALDATPWAGAIPRPGAGPEARCPDTHMPCPHCGIGIDPFQMILPSLASPKERRRLVDPTPAHELAERSVVVKSGPLFVEGSAPWRASTPVTASDDSAPVVAPFLVDDVAGAKRKHRVARSIVGGMGFEEYRRGLAEQEPGASSAGTSQELLSAGTSLDFQTVKRSFQLSHLMIANPRSPPPEAERSRPASGDSPGSGGRGHAAAQATGRLLSAAGRTAPSQPLLVAQPSRSLPHLGAVAAAPKATGVVSTAQRSHSASRLTRASRGGAR
jgi:hypothetical protein